jgi:hypothetical protein
VTLAIVLWLERGMGHAVAEGDGHGVGTPSGNGDVNGDGRLDISDPIYIVNWLFGEGPAPVPIECPLTGLLATGQTKCYDTAATEIDCASVDWPGQDGFYQTGYGGDGRFVDNQDGTVTDTCTGLMWQKDTADTNGNGSIGAEHGLDWQGALKYCESLDFAGHDDWRLPNVRELQSIADYGRYEPSIDPVFGAVSSGYWSSSAYVSNAIGAWGVLFDVGYVVVGEGFGEAYVRAVRSGP